MTQPTREDGFCPNCGVSMDLHPDGSYYEDNEYRACDIAEQKAELLSRFPFATEEAQ